jgi:DNA-binding NarL/FixJ family response regulator
MRVAVLEDNHLVRQGIVHCLQEADIEVALAVAEPAALLAEVYQGGIDVALVDVRLPPTFTDEGLQVASAIRRAHPATGVLVLSQFVEPEFILPLLSESAERVGYLLKDRVLDTVTLVDALRRVLAGELVIDPAIVAQLMGPRRTPDQLASLTEREREVLAAMAEGLTNVGIARQLFISERTVEVHLAHIFDKLRIDDSSRSNRRVLAVLTHLAAERP